MSLFAKLKKRNKSGSSSLVDRTVQSSSAAASSSSQPTVPEREEKYGLFRLDTNTDTFEGTAASEPLPPGAVDIIAVHGLLGDAYGTWTHGNGKLWLRDFMDDFPNARIFTYGYDSSIAFSRTKGDVETFARTLLNRLREKRSSQEVARPIVFVSYSLGGIVVKQAMLIAHNEAKFYPGILASVKAILFLGTPHRGSDIANYGAVLSNLANAVLKTSQASRTTGTLRKDLLDELSTNAPGLLKIATDFRVHTGGIQITSFIEDKVEPGLNTRLVDHTTSVMGLNNERIVHLTDRDHSQICRYATKNSNDLELVLGAIRDGMHSPTPQSTTSIASLPHAAPDNATSYDQIPFSWNPCFVGREDILTQIETSLTNPRYRGRLALWGLGGSGKTQIALEYCHRQKEKSPRKHIFWVFAGSSERFRSDYNSIATGLAIPGHDDPAVDKVKLVKDFLETPGASPWLMVVDNADDLEVFESDIVEAGPNLKLHPHLLDDIPESHSGTVIFTTRNKGNALALTRQGVTCNVGAMDQVDSLALLEDSLNGEGSDKENWTVLLEALEHHPLAIVQAASYIRENTLSASDYIELLHEQSSDFSLQILAHDPALAGKEKAVTNATFKTWEITMRQLEERFPDSAHMLFRMAFFHRQNIPVYLLQTQDESLAAVKVVAAKLISYAFVSSTGSAEGSTTYTLHSLIHLFTRHWLSHGKNEADRWALDALRAIDAWTDVHLAESDNLNKSQRCTELVPHVQSMILGVSNRRDLSNEDLSTLSRIAYSISFPLCISHHGDLVEDIILSSLTLLPKNPQYGQPLCGDVFELASLLAGISSLTKGPTTAETILCKYIPIIEEFDDQLSRSAIHLASTYSRVLCESGKFDAAEDWARRAIRSAESTLEEDDRIALHCQRQLSRALRAQLKYDESNVVLRRMSDVYAHSPRYGPKHPESLIPRYDWVLHCTRTGQYEEAEQGAKSLYQEYCEIWGPENVFTLNCLYMLAFNRCFQGRHYEARNNYQEVIRRRREIWVSSDSGLQEWQEELDGCMTHIEGQFWSPIKDCWCDPIQQRLAQPRFPLTHRDTPG